MPKVGRLVSQAVKSIKIKTIHNNQSERASNMGQFEQELNKTIQKTTTIKTAEYLTFALAQEVYWIDYLKLKEILGMMNATSIPRTSEFVKGVIDPRGKVIPFNDELSILVSPHPI